MEESFNNSFLKLIFYFKLMADSFYFQKEKKIKEDTENHQAYMASFLFLTEPVIRHSVLLGNLHLFGAVFHIKWCYKVFGMNSPEIVLKNSLFSKSTFL